ncbi:hypothetical protein [Micromonospora craniellae]|uniref:Uncharacterized protein n=1 Tax=Micromonospora craniellae TaxID=2294034 RepID=A0A372FRI9_9ACTN|nr:hypothetical protein [Micromonospora craniellae]QOC93902.1 hypothetical protein ID554_09930 [Micromonospora craniellae]RFS41041.1 hypothetical protein D0Q02_29620 [Micromonospora craniellae]
MVGDEDPNTVANHPTHHHARCGDLMAEDDTSLWLLTDLARCTTCWQLLQPYAPTPRRRFYVCFCLTLHPAEHLEALVVGSAAAHDRRTSTARPLITYQRWHQSTRTELRQHLTRLIDQTLVHHPDRIELHWHPHVSIRPLHQP